MRLQAPARLLSVLATGQPQEHAPMGHLHTAALPSLLAADLPRSAPLSCRRALGRHGGHHGSLHFVVRHLCCGTSRRRLLSRLRRAARLCLLRRSHLRGPLRGCLGGRPLAGRDLWRLFPNWPQRAVPSPRYFRKGYAFPNALVGLKSEKHGLLSLLHRLYLHPVAVTSALRGVDARRVGLHPVGQSSRRDHHLRTGLSIHGGI
mmetsp:Transcript_38445/g.110364  ORF Transcript_38445/g.110364 Transcript_38445/m.110364 type:complete len:204 (+) Transcript_38445:52-663(+)